MIDFNHRLKPGNVSEAVNALLDRALDERPEEARGYLGASAAGDSCDRRLGYQAQGLRPDHAAAARMRRIFERGHLLEERTARELHAAGFVLRRGKIGFAAAEGRFKGHVDGVIEAAPLAIRLPALWEHKGLKAEAWRKLVRGGLGRSNPKYAVQIALYQAYLEPQFPGISRAPALFTATNADSMELYHELVPFDGALAQKASDRIARILQATAAGETLPRVALEPGYFECRYCGWRNRCWEIDR